MGNYFPLLHPADHAGGRASRQDDGHGTTMYSDVEAEAMFDCALEAMKVQCAAMEIAIQRYSRNNEIGQAAAIDLLHRAEALNEALLHLQVEIEHSQIDRLAETSTFRRLGA